LTHLPYICSVNYQMKKLFSILLAGLIIVSSVHLTIATHYCGNAFEGYKVSVSGEKASCGMERELPASSHENSISHNCCTDKLASYLINDNYSPASFHFIKSVQSAFVVPFGIANFISIAPALSNLKIAHAPPGEFLPCKVELASICLFRI
jgi:hypothetical protein